ncbi:SDR family oxidoreductase [Mechercharimyces sp. CAU 1602]|uniref:SDR family oxidoreductase n=1 Tax=Mechercharimyces sp. CAU 1602 TaxID=2973933 RepID=UPI002162915B|nr:SDR family oxidoreductase [Mechercharimyces sp. CAU 1602]MCS1351317.1 SDR family oxidoreductase [Mechercharimyces sp. CAU 1602]
MNITVIGANGNIGREIVRTLLERNHEVRAMIRKEEQASFFINLGATPVIADLEQDFSHAIDGADAIIFTAGSGAHTGLDKTTAIDQEGAKKAADLAEQYGVDRFIMISSIKADQPEAATSDAMKHYLRAKSAADKHLRTKGINYTILRPGRLSDEKGTGKIVIAPSLEYRTDSIPRADVALTAVESLEAPGTFRHSFDLFSGNEEVQTALAKLA